jgi:hypothetical protein
VIGQKHGHLILFHLHQLIKRTIPELMTLDQKLSNPFNPSTKIHYAINSTQFVSLKFMMYLEMKLLHLLMSTETPEVMK